MDCEPDKILNSEGFCVCPPGKELSTDTGDCITECPAGSDLVDGECKCPGGQIQINGECKCPRDRIWINGECVNPCPDGQVFDGVECNCPPGKRRSSSTTMSCEDIPTGEGGNCFSGITTGNSNAKLQSRYNTNFRSRQMLHPHLRKWAELWLPRSLRLLHSVFRPPIQQIPNLPQRNLLPRHRHRSRDILQPARDLRRTSTHVKREEKDLRQQRQGRRVHDPHAGVLGERQFCDYQVARGEVLFGGVSV
jgi:hypothetical protein